MRRWRLVIAVGNLVSGVGVSRAWAVPVAFTPACTLAWTCAFILVLLGASEAQAAASAEVPNARMDRLDKFPDKKCFGASFGFPID